MPPSELRQQSLKALRATRRDLASAAFLLKLAREPVQVQVDAAHHALDVESAIRALENKQLEAIRDQLVANEADLLAGMKGLDEARAKLAKIEGVLRAAGAFLDVLAKIVSFTATRGIG